MKRVILYMLLVLGVLYVHAAGDSRAIEVSVLTCSPGQEVYSLYGHTAIRFQDKARSVDYVFNYGVFDFNTEYFIWKFVLGKTDYQCVAVPWEYFLQEYRQRGSSVVAQVLNLTQEEAEAVKAYLYDNIREENRVYRYNYLTNNCTTRVMDCVDACVDGEISYSWDTAPHTYRQMMHEYTKAFPWAQEGNDVLLGAEVDTVLSHRATCFLPEYYSRALADAVVRDDIKDTRCLVKETVIVLEANAAVSKTAVPVKGFPLTPLKFGCLVFVTGLLLMLLEFLTRKMFWLVDVFLMLGHGLAGCLIMFVFLFSEHPSLDSNWLVAVLNPLPLVALPYVVKAAWTGQVTFWHHFMAIWLAMFLLFIPWIPQQLGVFVVTVVATLLSRQVSYLLHYGRTSRPNSDKKRNKSSRRKR
ncbi:MAG: DUF4105 domain-containing protein [Paraprevotella sp.]|nr:DUF4105 domain-containing protein [Paraprevotella sp.]